MRACQDLFWYFYTGCSKGGGPSMGIKQWSSGIFACAAHGTGILCVPGRFFLVPRELTVSVASAITAICASLSAFSVSTAVSRALFLFPLTGDMLRALLQRLDDWYKPPLTPALDPPPPLMPLARDILIVSTRTRFSSSSALRDK